MASSSYGLLGRILPILALLMTAASALASLNNTDLTSCGRSCLEATVAKLGCELSSTACQCQPGVLHTTAACLAADCSMEDTLTTFKVQASVCDLPSESRTSVVAAAAAVSITFLVLFSSIRVGGKFATKRHGSDDIVILVCFFLGMTIFSLFIINASNGLGSHMWDIPNTKTLVGIVQLVFIVKILLQVATPLVKIAIVLFYMTIFRSTRSRRVAWALIAFIALSGVATILSVLLRCKPLAYFWNRDLSGGECHDAFVTYGLSAGLAVAQDTCLVAFPAFQIRKLQMKTRKKVFVVGMFALGGAGYILAIVHLQQVLQTPHKRDPSWDHGRLETIAASEFVVCYMGACLPMIGACLAYVFPKRFGSTGSGTLSTRAQPWTTNQPEQFSAGSKFQASSSTRRSALNGLELPMMRPKSTNEWYAGGRMSDTQPLAPEPAHLAYSNDSDPEQQASADKAYADKAYEGGRGR